MGHKQGVFIRCFFLAHTHYEVSNETAADELKTDKRRWFSTEHVIKLQNFLPQEFKEAKHYISAEGNCCCMEEESSKENTYSCSGNPASANCWGLREYSGEVLLHVIVFLHASLDIYYWVLLVRGYLKRLGAVGLAHYGHYFVVKPIPFLNLISLLRIFQNPFQRQHLNFGKKWGANLFRGCLSPLLRILFFL